MAKVIGFDESAMFKVTCEECSAIVEYARNEVKNKRVSCMGDVDHIDYIECPNCKTDIDYTKKYK